MAKHFWVLLLVSLPFATSFGQSCCNAGGLSSCGSTGLLTNLRNNSIGLRFMAVPFETTASGEESYRDNFLVAEFVGRYQVSSRIRVGIQQPYRWNYRQQTGQDELLHGLADTRLMGNYTLLDNKQFAHTSLIYLEMGAGLKLPTGKYDQSIYFRDLPGNLNLGMGNFGYLLQSNLVVFHKKMGVAHTLGVQLNGKSRDDYHFGHQFSSSLLLFRELALNEKNKLVPMAGISTEYFGKNHFPSGNFAEGSGGHGWLAQAGLNARFRVFQVSALTSLPIEQDYSQRAIVAKQRYSLELTYFL
ncbi:MAG: hypothetical protein GC192_08705 [Bacteroidetes bacterium]|nr:hypothetical protein [Bacteroidota bacterium]